MVAMLVIVEYSTITQDREEVIMRIFKRLRLLAPIAGLFVLAAPILPAGAASTLLVTVGNTQSSATPVEDTTNFTTSTSIAANSTNPNQIVLTLNGQNLSSVTAADVWTNNIPGVGTPTVSGNTVTIPFTGALGAGVDAEITVDNISNGSAGTYTDSVSSQDYSGGSYVNVDTATTNVTISSNSVSATVRVGQALEFILQGPTSFALSVDPVNHPTDQETNLNTITVNDNAASASIGVNDTGLTTGTVSYPENFTGTASSPAAWTTSPAGFGYSLDGTNAPSGFNSGSYWAAFSKTTENIATLTGPQQGWTVNVSYRAVDDWTVQDGIYTDTIKFIVTPTW